MILISNTGPLIALAKIAKVSLLRELGFEAVQVPRRVHHELWGRIGLETAEIETAVATFICVVDAPPAPEALRSAIAGLGQGEQEVLNLACAMGKDALVLLDDRAGRTVARELGLRVTGTVGILLLAKRRGLIDRVLPLLEEARNNGYWLSDALLDSARRLAGE